jgi:hypothetical protein
MLAELLSPDQTSETMGVPENQEGKKGVFVQKGARRKINADDRSLLFCEKSSAKKGKDTMRKVPCDHMMDCRSIKIR